MLRPILALVTIALSAAPATAATYSAILSIPANGRIIVRDISWDCNRAACRGTTDNSRPAVLCQSLAKRAGHIDNFLVDGRALAAAELGRCNASARPDATQAVASK